MATALVAGTLPLSACSTLRPGGSPCHAAAFGCRSERFFVAQRGCRPRAVSGTDGGYPLNPESGSTPASITADVAPPARKSVLTRIKYFFVGDGLDKQRLAALGMGAFASYGVISNANYGIALTVSWLAFVKQTGVSPLAPGQWRGFLAFYAGMWAVQNFARPLRLSLALALAPAFDKVICNIAATTRLSKKWAFGILLVGIAAVTTTTMFGTIYLLGGFPPTA